MGFNLGAFAGGLAQGGVNTYKLLSEIDSQKKRDKLVDIQTQSAQDALDEEKAIKAARADTLGRVTPPTLSPNQSQAIATNDNTQAQPSAIPSAATPQAIPTGQPQAAAPDANAQPAAPAQQPYTQQQAWNDYITKMRAINPEKAAAAELANFQLKNAKRESDFNDRYDALQTDWNKKIAGIHSDITDTLAKDGAAGAIKKFGPEYKAQTGADVSLMGNNVIVKKDGKVVSQFPASELGAKLEGELSQHYTTGFADEVVKQGLFKDPKDAIAYMQKKAELRNQSITANAAAMNAETQREYQGIGGVIDRGNKAHMDVLRDAYVGKSPAAMGNQAVEAMADKVINPSTGKYYTKDEAYALGVRSAIHDPTLKGSTKQWTMSQDGTFRTNNQGIVQDYDPKSNNWITRGLPQVSKNAAGIGVSAGLGDDGQVAFKGKDGWYHSEREAVESFRGQSANTQNSQPAVDNKKYIRNKTSRGGYEYSPGAHGAGHTKAEWAAIDAGQ
jgi:hypothetical protein